MIHAKDAIDGSVYRIPAKGKRPEHKEAVFQGWNQSKEWLLFLVAGQWGKRSTTIVLPDDEIEVIQ